MSKQHEEPVDAQAWPPKPGAVKALAGTEDVYRPALFDAGDAQAVAELRKLLAEGRVLQVHDTLAMQLRDLVESYHPSERAMTDAEAEGHIAQLLRDSGRTLETYGNWVHYPWSGKLVRVLPREEFFLLRTDRNRLRLTLAQQRELLGKRIGVVGLSVGQATALTLALEGVGGHFKIADFDTLGLSNLNRLRSGVHNLGVNKGVMAAREMYELNPYITVEVYPRGISEDQLDTFLLGGGRLDLLVEECDDLAMKVRLRERARELRMPVMMETSDRGMLDIERFDVEPQRPLLHGLMGNVDSKSLAGLPTKEKVPFFLRVVDDQRMSTQLLGSLIEIKTSISTWPQLASAVALGGAVVTDAARRMLLGQLKESGRYYVDLSELVRDGSAVKLQVEEEAPQPLVGPTQPPEPLPRPTRGTGAVTQEEVRYLVKHAVLAPSGGNCQPWRFHFAGGRLEAHADPSRARGFLDWRALSSFTAMGAALENLHAAAAALGLVPDVKLQPDPERPLLAFTATFTRGEPAPDADARLRLVYERTTNRRRGDGRPLEDANASALQASVADPRARLHLLRTPRAIAEIGALLGQTDRFLMTNRTTHHEMMGEMRWTSEDVRTHRDGLELASMELSKVDHAGVTKVLRQWRAMEFLKNAGAGRGLETAGRDATVAASAVGLLTYEGTGGESYIRGGQALARVWSTASVRGLAFQPHSPITYLFARLLRGDGEGFTDEQKTTLRGMRERYEKLFELTGQEAEVLLFRVSHAGPPTVRSLRRELDEVLTLEG